jgi:hypothetical protein
MLPIRESPRPGLGSEPAWQAEVTDMLLGMNSNPLAGTSGMSLAPHKCHHPQERRTSLVSMGGGPATVPAPPLLLGMCACQENTF